MKVIALNGSPRTDGNTKILLEIMAEELEKEGIETEIIDVGHLAVRGCTACTHCKTAENGECVFDDDPVNATVAKIRDAQGFIISSPTYYAAIAGTMKSFLDRLFYSGSKHFRLKVAAAAVAVRRAGGVDTIHQLKNYLDLAQVITAPSQYWTVGYGKSEGEVLEDPEGIQTIRKNARAMAWLIKVVEEGKKSFPVPEDEKRIYTSFVR